MPSRVAFVSSGERTLLFKSVADILSSHGHEVFWITTGSHRVRDIVSSYTQVLDISLFSGIYENNLQDLDFWSEISLSSIIQSDRILSRKPIDVTYAYLSNAYRNIRSYLVDHNVEIVFGEATWSGELVTAAVCRELGIEYLSPATVRYPKDRFAFFRGIFQKDIFSPDGVPDLSGAVDVINNFRSREKFVSQTKNWLNLFFKHLKRHIKRDIYDFTVPSLWSLVSKTILSKLNQCAARAFYQKIPDGDYVYLPLHVQPEASLDVLGRFHTDTFAYVENISKAVPFGLKIIVKEHAGYARDLRFYNKLKKLSNVVFVNSEFDSILLIKKAKAVISVSGTACYEAGLLKTPAVTFAEVYFNDLSFVKKCIDYEDLYDVLKNVNAEKESNDNRNVFVSRLIAMSYKGVVCSPQVCADVLSEQNISDVASAFIDIIGYSSSKSATADSMCSRFI